MRNVFLLVALFVSVASNAQVWIGGSLGLDVVKPDLVDSKTITTFSIAPEVGYSYNKRFDVAISLSENLLNFDNETAHMITVEPYIRWTFANSDKVSFFVEGGFGVGYAEFADGEILDDSQIKFYIGFRPGVKFVMSDKVGLVAKLGFIGYQKVENAYEAFGFNVNNNSLSLGIYYNF